ncbi:flavin reductase [Micromonospora sp. NPDC000089]|uniref:flavin reductase n=1 Tax=unclassified Micromonospora TaxID=2617518 RepID=UPI003693CF54
MTAHVPVRPSWACAACAEDWPCDVRRAELAAEPRTSVMVFLAGHFGEAVGDLPAVPVGELYRRFLGGSSTAPARDNAKPWRRR